MYKIEATNKFQKDLKLCIKRGLKKELLIEVLKILESHGKLPSKYKQHSLKGNYSGYLECHIQPDWLLIWEQFETIKLISLTRTGTHSDLFK